MTRRSQCGRIGLNPILTIFAFLAFLFQPLYLRAEGPNLDSLLQKVALEPNDSVRFYMVYTGLTLSERDPVRDMRNAEVILLHGQKHNDAVCQVLAFGCLGYDYLIFGNTAKSVENSLQAYRVAEESGKPRLIASGRLFLAFPYMTLGDVPKAISNLKSAMDAIPEDRNNEVHFLANLTLGEIYLSMEKIDSALIHTQRAYEIFAQIPEEIKIKTFISDYLGQIYNQLGSIHLKMNNPTLAMSYWDLALEEAMKIQSPKFICSAYTTLARYYYDEQRVDSAAYCATKAIRSVQNTPFSTASIVPAKLLIDIYQSGNKDSAFKYSEIYRIAQDSLYNIRAIQQAQLMTFEEERRLQQKAELSARDEERRRQNIQYTLIALGIVTFVVLYLLLSRRTITNPKVIVGFGVVALLIVFEFLNLLLHPFLESTTHGSPLFMLVGLVCIAALLVPLHHRIEKWATTRLVEKNKELRLSHAKETIRELGGKEKEAG